MTAGQALPGDEGEDDPLYQLALAVEHDQRLATEMADWDATIGVGAGGFQGFARVSGVPIASVVVRAVDNARLMRLSGQLTRADLQAIEDGMRAVLVL